MIVPNPFSFRIAMVRIKKPGYRKRRTELHAYPFYLERLLMEEQVKEEENE